MSYGWAYPDSKILVCPTETQNTNKNNWSTKTESIERVMGEVARCGNYFIDAIKLWNDVSVKE